jgi:hypothetical protein
MKTIPFWILLITTFGLAGAEKLFGGGVPSWFTDQFGKTLLATLPGGMPAAFYFIMLCELATFSFLTLGLIRGEFMGRKPMKFLPIGSFIAQITFVELAFGQRLTHQYNEAAQLFAYAVLTFLGTNLALASSSGSRA